MTVPYRDYHCLTCKKLLFKGIIIEGDVEIKCKRCHEISLFKKSELDDYLCAIKNCPNKVRFRPQEKLAA